MQGSALHSGQLDALLGELYREESSEFIQELSSQLLQSLQTSTKQITEQQPRWDASTAVLITYANTLQRDGERGLTTLKGILNTHFSALDGVVHVLPFLKASSDGGFAVASHNELEPGFGEWTDLAALAEGRTVMADLVLNHVSASHPWVLQFLQRSEPGRSCILAPDPEAGWANVIRPRSTSLFTTLATDDGPRPVWSTFGPDQLDLDWSEPQVLLGFSELLGRLSRHGVSWLRLDAVGFVWKEEGTTCLHRPQAYTVVRILRQLLEIVSSRGVVVTETNVPEQENLSYLRSGNDAHLAYNFPLPPLLVEALISRRADLLNQWLARWPELPAGTSLLNFSACHDGIGLRPLEGLMPPERVHELLVACERRGGLVSHRRLASGKESPYEINISWWSAMADGGVDPSHLQLQRFLLSQLLVMALPGVPAFYLPALVAAANDMKQFRSTGHRRDLNRPKFQAERLERQLADPDQPASKILKQLQAAMELRSQRPAMDPEAPMELLSSDRSDVVILKRGTPSQALWAVHNFSNRRLSFPLAKRLQLPTDTAKLSWSDALSGSTIGGPYLELEPFAVHWLELG